MGRASSGVALYDFVRDTAKTFYLEEGLPESFGLMSCYVDEFDQLWLGSNKGLYLLPDAGEFDLFEDDLFAKAIKVKLPNGENGVISAIEKTDEYIVVGSKKSLTYIPRDKYSEGIDIPLHQNVFGEDINGNGVVQNAMLYDQERFLWVAANEGLLKVDMTGILLDSTSSLIEFKNLNSSGQKINIKNNTVKLHTDKRNLSLSFRPAKNPSLLNNIYYKFSITNSRKDTVIKQYLSKNASFSIDYLSPDNYNLEVSA